MRRLGAWPDAVAVAGLGALQTLCFVHTAAWAAHLALVALFAWRIALASPRRAAALGLAFGTAWLGCGTWWLYISLHRYGGLPAPLSVLAVGGLSVALSLYLAAAMALFARWRSGPAWRQGLLFGALWLLAELARGVIFTGFPWLASGYAHVDGPLGGFAPWVGVYGIGFIVGSLAGALGGLGAAASFRPPQRPSPRDALTMLASVAAVLVLGAVAGRASFTEPTRRLSVTLLQGNVPQEEKFASEHVGDSLAWTAASMRQGRGELVVGPETVIPLLPDQVDPAYWRDLLKPFQSGARAVLFGAPLGSDADGYTNSALGVSAALAGSSAAAYRYDKHHLVPFGEFIPAGFRWFTELMHIPLGDFKRGPLGAPSFDVKGERVAPNICYEDLFGEELAARFVVPAAAPTMFANLSNIGWFGRSIAVAQHLQISRLRTLEFQVPMLRATNTGATAVIDHRAVVTAQLAPFTQGVLQATVEGRRGVTPYAWWAGRFDLWPLWLGAVVLVVALKRRQRA